MLDDGGEGHGSYDHHDRQGHSITSADYRSSYQSEYPQYEHYHHDECDVDQSLVSRMNDSQFSQSLVEQQQQVINNSQLQHNNMNMGQMHYEIDMNFQDDGYYDDGMITESVEPRFERRATPAEHEFMGHSLQPHEQVVREHLQQRRTSSLSRRTSVSSLGGDGYDNRGGTGVNDSFVERRASQHSEMAGSITNTFEELDATEERQRRRASFQNYQSMQDVVSGMHDNDGERSCCPCSKNQTRSPSDSKKSRRQKIIIVISITVLAILCVVIGLAMYSNFRKNTEHEDVISDEMMNNELGLLTLSPTPAYADGNEGTPVTDDDFIIRHNSPMPSPAPTRSATPTIYPTLNNAQSADNQDTNDNTPNISNGTITYPPNTASPSASLSPSVQPSTMSPTSSPTPCTGRVCSCLMTDNSNSTASQKTVSSAPIPQDNQPYVCALYCHDCGKASPYDPKCTQEQRESGAMLNQHIAVTVEWIDEYQTAYASYGFTYCDFDDCNVGDACNPTTGNNVYADEAQSGNTNANEIEEDDNMIQQATATSSPTGGPTESPVGSSQTVPVANHPSNVTNVAEDTEDVALVTFVNVTSGAYANVTNATKEPENDSALLSLNDTNKTITSSDLNTTKLMNETQSDLNDTAEPFHDMPSPYGENPGSMNVTEEVGSVANATFDTITSATPSNSMSVVEEYSASTDSVTLTDVMNETEGVDADLWIAGNDTDVSSPTPPIVSTEQFSYPDGGQSDVTNDLTSDLVEVTLSTDHDMILVESPTMESLNSQYGSSVAISGDGNIVAVGAKDAMSEYSGEATGAVYLYSYSDAASTSMSPESSDANSLTLIQILYGQSSGDEFGNAVSLSQEGNRIVIGSRSRNGQTGAIWIFHRDNVLSNDTTSSEWSLMDGGLIPGLAPSERAGWALDISGDGNVIAMGSPRGGYYREGYIRVFRYNYISLEWDQYGSIIQGTAGEALGYSVALSYTGSTIIAGSPMTVDSNGFTSVGKVTVYYIIISQWQSLGEDVYGESEGNAYGSSVAMSHDGSIVVIGGRGRNKVMGRTSLESTGHCVIYLLQSRQLEYQYSIEGEAAEERLGTSVSVSPDGNIVACGGVGGVGGVVRLWNRETLRESTIRPHGEENEIDRSDFGASVSLSAGGEYILVGAPTWGKGSNERSGAIQMFK